MREPKPFTPSSATLEMTRTPGAVFSRSSSRTGTHKRISTRQWYQRVPIDAALGSPSSRLALPASPADTEWRGSLINIGSSGMIRSTHLDGSSRVRYRRSRQQGPRFVTWKALELPALLCEIRSVRGQGPSRLMAQANQVDSLPNNSTINGPAYSWGQCPALLGTRVDRRRCWWGSPLRGFF